MQRSGGRVGWLPSWSKGKACHQNDWNDSCL